jgi:hypothetical protein
MSQSRSSRIWIVAGSVAVLASAGVIALATQLARRSPVKCGPVEPHSPKFGDEEKRIVGIAVEGADARGMPTQGIVPIDCRREGDHWTVVFSGPSDPCAVGGGTSYQVRVDARTEKVVYALYYQ